MLDKSQYTLVLIAMFSMLSMFSINTRGGEVEKGDLTPTETAPMNIEVTDIFGHVELSDVVSVSDPILNFNLDQLPIGQYTIQVRKAGKLLNTHYIHNASANRNVLTTEILDANGVQVFRSVNADKPFDLTKLPKGNYTIKVYQGQDLINSSKISNF